MALTAAQQSLLDDASLNISMRSDGVLVYESWFEKRWKAAGGDFGYLTSVIEDHIFDGPDGEDIDWGAVEREMNDARS